MSAAGQAFHLAVVAYHVVVSHWINENMLKNKDHPNIDSIGKTLQLYSLRYLTIWTFILQNIFFFTALGYEILSFFNGLEKIKGHVNKFKNYLFTVLAAPMALVVTTVFWGIWYVDRDLIFPESLDTLLPFWANHALHTITSVLVLFEMFLFYHKYPAFNSGVLGIALFLAIYSGCLFGTYVQNGVWLYPIFKNIDWTLRIAFCLSVFLLTLAIYGAGYLFNKLMWGERAETKKAPKKKHKKH